MHDQGREQRQDLGYQGLDGSSEGKGNEALREDGFGRRLMSGWLAEGPHYQNQTGKGVHEQQEGEATGALPERGAGMRICGGRGLIANFLV